MSQTAIIGVVLVMVMCSSSSVASLLMTGGDSSNTASSNTSTTEYKYDFIINKAAEHGTYGSHITEIRVDGVRVTPSQITIHVEPDHAKCNSKDGGYDCEDGKYGLNDPEPSPAGLTDLTWTAWKKETETAGKKMFTITTTSKVKEFEIDHFRPTYQPGYIIKENGKEVLKETTNGGSASSPNPKTVKYTIQ